MNFKKPIYISSKEKTPWRKTKKGKKTIAICSGFFAATAALGTVGGVLSAYSMSRQTNIDNTYYYKKGEIRLNNDGTVMIPKVVDVNNPYGIYKNALPNIQSEINPASTWTDANWIKRRDSVINKVKTQLFKINILNDKTEFPIDDKLKAVIDFAVPNNKIDINSNTNMYQLSRSLYDTLANPKEHETLSINKISDMLALVGINYQKEYNDAIEKSDINNTKKTNTPANLIQFYPDPLIFPLGHDSYRPSVPKINYDEPEKYSSSLLMQPKEYIEKVLQQNLHYQNIFAETNSIVLPILVVTEAILTTIAYFTFGTTVAEIAEIVVDIIFMSVELAISYTNIDITKSEIWIIENIENFRNEIGKIEYDNKFYANLSDIFEAISTIKDIYSAYKEIKEFKKYKGDYSKYKKDPEYQKGEKILTSFKYKSEELKAISYRAVSTARLTTSVFAATYSVIMLILEESLITPVI